MGTYGDKICTKFRGVNLPQDDIECRSFAVISIDPLLVYENKHCLQVYKQMIDYLDNNAFETEEDCFLINGFYKWCITTNEQG